MVILSVSAFCIAKGKIASWRRYLTGGVLTAAFWAATAGPTHSDAAAGVQPGDAAIPRQDSSLLAAPVPRVAGRLRAGDLGLVINARDPYSVALGTYYASRRGLRPEQILRVDLPVRAVLAPSEFEALKASIDQRFGPRIQALALAWSTPYAVSCNSITGALALGFDPELCRSTCKSSRASPYANARTTRPFTDLGMRPSMLLAARTLAEGRAMIDRGVKSDRSLALKGGSSVTAAYVLSDDLARKVRDRLYPPAGELRRFGVKVRRVADLNALTNEQLILAQVGTASLHLTAALHWAPGALADHLTSYGGQLDGLAGQSTAQDWISAGATASHGTVSEPCNHLQKFPHPQWLLLHYLQGSSAIEAYWKSVLWPQQSLFIGEPLASPFSRR